MQKSKQEYFECCACHRFARDTKNSVCLKIIENLDTTFGHTVLG